MQKKIDKPEAGKIYALTDREGKPSIANGNTWAQSEVMTDEQLAKAVDLDVSDFSDDGADLDELRDIIEGGI